MLAKMTAKNELTLPKTVTDAMGATGRGVEPLCLDETKTTEEMLKQGETTLLEAKLVDKCETIVIMAGRLSGLGLSSSVVVWTIGEDVPRR